MFSRNAIIRASGSKIKPVASRYFYSQGDTLQIGMPSELQVHAENEEREMNMQDLKILKITENFKFGI